MRLFQNRITRDGQASLTFVVRKPRRSRLARTLLRTRRRAGRMKAGMSRCVLSGSADRDSAQVLRPCSAADLNIYLHCLVLDEVYRHTSTSRSFMRCARHGAKTARGQDHQALMRTADALQTLAAHRVPHGGARFPAHGPIRGSPTAHSAIRSIDVLTVFFQYQGLAGRRSIVCPSTEQA
jgi:hypothetical protein